MTIFEHRAIPGLASVIVLNHDGSAIMPIIRESVHAILAQDYAPGIELVLVDDNSTDGSDLQIEALCAETQAIYTSTREGNHGISAARNLGLRHTRGEFVAFLDNDAIPEQGWLAALVVALSMNPLLGSVASRVMFADKPDVVNSMGSVLNELFHGNGVCIHELYPPAEPPARIMYATGNGMMLRREAIETVGPFDEGFLFWGADDADYGMRLHRAGWECAPVPTAAVRHLHSFSKQASGMPFWDGRNRIRMALKHQSWRELPKFIWRDIRYYASPGRFRDYVRYWWSTLSHSSGRRDLFTYRRAHRGEPPFAAAFAEFFRPPQRLMVVPDNRTFGREATPLQSVQIGDADEAFLYHGWYWPERWGTSAMRWAMRSASLLFELPHGSQTFTLQLLGRPGAAQTQLSLEWQRLGDAGYESLASQMITLNGPARPDPQVISVDCALPAGIFRMVLVAEQATIESGFFPRQLGFGLSRLTVT